MDERNQMTSPRFHTFDTKRNLPIHSTGSLAIASLIVAGCALIMALSPLLLPAFLPIALLGLVLAIMGLFSYRDRSALQVGAMSINGLIVLFALLKGPVGMLQPASASEFEMWSPSASLHGADRVIPGWLLQRETSFEDGRSNLDFVIQWDVSSISGCWNWFEGTLRVRSIVDGSELELDWYIDGPIHSGVVIMQGHRLTFDDRQGDLDWITRNGMDELEITFKPIQWEHTALAKPRGVRSQVQSATASRRQGLDGIE